MELWFARTYRFGRAASLVLKCMGGLYTVFERQPREHAPLESSKSELDLRSMLPVNSLSVTHRVESCERRTVFVYNWPAEDGQLAPAAADEAGQKSKGAQHPVEKYFVRISNR